jgi:RimJ/RimL family protein N-acetyltransferase
MITLVKLDSADDIKTALVKDEIHKQLVGAYFNKDFDPQLKNTLWFLAVENNRAVGIVYLTAFTNNCVCFHGGIYKEFRGADSLRIFLETLTEVKKVVTYKIIFTISSYNTKAKAIAKKAGYVYKTTIEDGLQSGPLEIYAEE